MANRAPHECNATHAIALHSCGARLAIGPKSGVLTRDAASDKLMPMSSWEEIADQVVPNNAPATGLATGASRRRKTGDLSGAIGGALGAERFLEPPSLRHNALPDEAWNGAEMWGASGAFYQIDQPTTFFDAESGNLRERLENALANPPSQYLEGLSPEDLLFCDIETTGLSSAEPLFLIGTMRFIEGAARLQLYLARTPDEEKAILEAFGAQLRAKTLVTFNGKSFDWPFIEGRANRNLVRLPKWQTHYDLLYSARRRYKGELPNCRLQTLEAGVCKRGRRGDIPSGRIPQQYYDFLDEAHKPNIGAPLLAPVIFHCALDVLTMAELICCMSE